MAVIKGTPGDDFREIVQSATFIYDALDGIDVLSLGQQKRSAFRIEKLPDGGVQIDSISQASGGGLKATLYNVEYLKFDYRSDFIDLRTYFEPLVVEGTDAEDRFHVAGQGRRFDGKEGIDTAVFDHPRGRHDIAREGQDWLVTGPDGGEPNRLVSVERMEFSDRKLAFDLDGDAGLVARVLGAVFGASSVLNPTYVGIGLRLTDQGVTSEALVHLALEARLGAEPSHTQLVDLLYGNVVGMPPTDAERAVFVDLLDRGVLTPDSLGVMASLHPANLQFALVGIAQVGLEYE